MLTCVRECVRAWMRACVRECVRACVCLFMCVRTSTWSREDWYVIFSSSCLNRLWFCLLINLKALWFNYDMNYIFIILRFPLLSTVTRRIGHPYQNRTPPKRKKPRTSFTRQQICELEKRFFITSHLISFFSPHLNVNSSHSISSHLMSFHLITSHLVPIA